MNKSELRIKRLNNEYNEIQRFVKRCPCISSCKVIKREGTAPTKYRFDLNIRTYIGEDKITDKCSVTVEFESQYPLLPPRVVMDDPVIFHPHWFDFGRWCFGKNNWKSTESIIVFLSKMIKSIQFDDADTIDPESLANVKAYKWYVKNKGKFPSDTKALSRVTIVKKI